MSRFSSFSVATSGLRAAQAGLYVTGHNMSNVDTTGYVRQRVLQNDYFYTKVGQNAKTNMQVGMGTDITGIGQIRNKFLDVSYRQEVPKLTYYAVKYNAGLEIEDILGELQSDYSTKTVINDLWDSINELTTSPTGLETRGNFISTAVKFLDRVNNISDRLKNQQHILNEQVKSEVGEINRLANEIQKYNKLISKNEVAGDNANDYRDARNNALDELSKIVKIDYYETKDGSVDVLIEGKVLVTNNFVRPLGLRYTSDKNSFVEPVFTDSYSIIPYDKTGQNAIPLFELTGKVGSVYKNDNGSLKGLLVTRGLEATNYKTNPNPADPNYKRQLFNLEQCTIPKIIKKLDTLVNGIVTTINNSVAPYYNDGGVLKKDPDAPYGIDANKTQHMEIFVRNNMDRYDENGIYNKEDADNYFSLYSIGNISINPEFLNSENYDKIAISKSGDVGDFEVVKDIMTNWKSKFISSGGEEKLSIDDYYNYFVTSIGIEINEAKSYSEEQQILVSQIDNKRKSISGVSLDEEMKNMMIYQHAYNASARVVNVIDSMIDKIINGTGRVGL